MAEEPEKRRRGRPAKGSPEELMAKRALRALRAHARTKGPAGFEEVKAQFPEVHRNTWNNWVRKVTAEYGRKAVGNAKHLAVANHVPGPMPAVLMEISKYADARIELMSMVKQLVYDAALMRESALIRDEVAGTEKIRNFVVFDASIRKRIDITRTVLAVQQEVYDVNRMAEFYDAILAIINEEIAPMAPAVRDRIVERLRELNRARLMTVNADPRA